MPTARATQGHSRVNSNERCAIEGLPVPAAAVDDSACVVECSPSFTDVTGFAAGDRLPPSIAVLCERPGATARVAVGDRSLDVQVAVTETGRTGLFVQDVTHLADVQQDFLATASHEFRTPLNGINGLLELLDDRLSRMADDDATDTRALVAEAIETTAGLRRVVADSLDLAAVGVGKLELATRRMSLRHVAAEAVAEISPAAADKALPLAYRVDAALPDRVVGDPVQLRRVLEILLDNAVRHTDAGDVVLDIEPEPTLDGDGRVGVRVNVHDRGPGVSDADAERIFAPFTRAAGSVSRRHSGAGLGLALARGIVGLSGGEIGVRSRPGGGSTFWVVLPIATVLTTDVPEVADVPDADAARTARPAPASDDDDRRSRPYVLVVDDNAVNRKVASRLLETMGVDSAVAVDGAQAVELVREHGADAFDLILMDCQMPGLDGFDATRTIRAIEAEAGSGRVPIVAFTANVMASDRQQCFEAGMDDYLAKPAGRAHIDDIVNRWLAAGGPDAAEGDAPQQADAPTAQSR